MAKQQKTIRRSAYGNRKNLTQKQLGEQLGFLGMTSDVRMAQYESEARIPKQNLMKQMAGILGVSPNALTVPDIDTYIGFLHTLFALEDIYGVKITEKDGLICLYRAPSTSSPVDTVSNMLREWQQQAEKLENSEISREEYDEWRYLYPELETSHHWAKTPSKEMSDYLIKKSEK